METKTEKLLLIEFFNFCKKNKLTSCMYSTVKSPFIFNKNFNWSPINYPIKFLYDIKDEELKTKITCKWQNYIIKKYFNIDRYELFNKFLDKYGIKEMYYDEVCKQYDKDISHFLYRIEHSSMTSFLTKLNFIKTKNGRQYWLNIESLYRMYCRKLFNNL